MVHLFTVLLPDEYRVNGEKRVALSVFQADDHASVKVEQVVAAFEGGAIEESGAFWDDLRAYIAHPHPEENYAKDLIGGGWAWVWMTEDEFDKGQGKPLNASRLEGYETVDGMNAWDHSRKAEHLALVERDDPNVGYPLTRFAAWLDELGVDEVPEQPWPTYVPMFSELGERIGLDKLFDHGCHLGGTSSTGQNLPRFGPAYVEWTEAFGGNLGGGTAQFDLKAGKLEWQC